MRYLTAIAFLLLAVPAWGQCGPSSPAYTQSGQTWTAATPGESDVQATFAAEQARPLDGDVIVIPSGTCTWTTPYNPSVANSLTVQGQTVVTCSGTPGTSSFACSATDNTVLVNNVPDTSSSPMFGINPIGTTGQVLRFTGLTFNGNGNDEYHGLSGYGGSVSGPLVRFDHSHFTDYYTNGIYLGQPAGYGVIDHNLFDSTRATNTSAVRIQGTIDGDTEWNEPTDFGSANFTYIEDNVINGGFMDDCVDGGRFVMRYDTLNATGNNAVQTHATGSGSGRDRGCRAWEVYHVYFTNSGGTGSTAEFWAASGTGLSYGNTVVDTGAPYTGWNHEFQIFSDRDYAVNNYNQKFPPNGWGTCGPGNTPGSFSVTVGINGAITGSGFKTTWLPKAIVTIGAINYPIISVASSSSMMVGPNLSSGYPPTGSATLYVASAWDGNAGNSGSQGAPCLDSFGRGGGDLLTGDFPNLVDASTGTITWPNQSFEPVYWWDETLGSGISLGYVDSGGNNIQANRDYYVPAGGGGGSIQVSPTSPFNGSSGTGFGTLANRPTSCTAGPGGTYYTSPTGSYGVAYFATDANGGNGELYVCTATNTWTGVYQPYTYPHPLVSGLGVSSNGPAAPTNLQARVN
jgi:hypothetical protein